MINKEIIINKKTRAITNGENGDLFRLGVDGENLQENIVFKFDDEFVNGTARIEITMQDSTKSYVMINKVNQTYVLPVKSILTKTGLNKMQLVITQGTDDEEIPIFKSKMFSFYIADSINADTEQPEEYPQWIDRANTTLNEIDNFDIDAIKELNEATITITDRYGETKSVQVYDGENGIDGKDAKINGVNTLRLLAGKNISLEQEEDELTISAEGGGESAVRSVNGMTGDVVIEIPDVSNFITKDVNDLTNYELKSSTANNLVASIDSSTYVMTLTLRNSNNETLNSQTIDLPLETMVVNGAYDSTNKKIILTLKNGNTIEFSVADLVSGLQTEITSSNKLNADLVDDTSSTNKFTNATEKATWNAKSDFSGDYDDLTNKPDLSGYQTIIDNLHKLDADLVDDSTSENTFFYVGKMSELNTTNWLDLRKAKKGVYLPDKTYNYMISNLDSDYSTSSTIRYYTLQTIFVIKEISNIETPSVNLYFAYALAYSVEDGTMYLIKFYVNTSRNIDFQTSSYGDTKMVGTSGQTINGQKTFTTIPRQSNTNAPTLDNQYTNKKYVDDQIALQIGNINTILATLTTPNNN